jgi:hypothetical protein
MRKTVRDIVNFSPMDPEREGVELRQVYGKKTGNSRRIPDKTPRKPRKPSGLIPP